MKTKPAAKRLPNGADVEPADDETVLSPIAEIPWHNQPPLLSTAAGYQAIRLDGVTFLVRPDLVEAFKAKYASRPHDDVGFEY